LDGAYCILVLSAAAQQCDGTGSLAIRAVWDHGGICEQFGHRADSGKLREGSDSEVDVDMGRGVVSGVCRAVLSGHEDVQQLIKINLKMKGNGGDE